MEGVIFILHKFSNDSLIHIQNFIKNFHEIIGNKFFPCIFLLIDNDKIPSNFKDSIDNINKKDLEELTLKYSFPLIKISKLLNEEDLNKIFLSIKNEISKEKHDEFPYSLAYRDQLEINYCIKNHKMFKFINIFIFIITIVNKFFNFFQFF